MSSKKRHKGFIVLAVAVFILIFSTSSFTETVIHRYDDLNRLETVENEDGSTLDYYYDEVGNRTSKIISVVNTGSVPGDCNGDSLVDAGDISALVLEFFDGDGSLPVDTPGGTFAGDPVGSDANEDGIVDAGDVSCTVLLIFNGQGVCGGGAASASSMSGKPLHLRSNTNQASQTELILDIPDRIRATAGGTVTVPVNFTANGSNVSALVFSVDYDENSLSFDPTDGDMDGIPNSITFNINPFAFFSGISFDPVDTDGELDFNISDASPPLASLPEGLLVSITFNVGNVDRKTEAPVNFSQDPMASFGDTAGQSVGGMSLNGSVLIRKRN